MYKKEIEISTLAKTIFNDAVYKSWSHVAISLTMGIVLPSPVPSRSTVTNSNPWFMLYFI